MMGDCLGTLGGADKKTKPGSVAGACQSIRWMANSLKAFKLWESRDCVWDSLLTTAYRQSLRVLAIFKGPTFGSNEKSTA